MFNPFKPAFGNMLQSVMTAPPNGGVAPAFRNPFAAQQSAAPTQPSNPTAPSNPAAPSSAPAPEQTTPEQPQSVAAQAIPARAGLSEIGAPVAQSQQTPGMALPSVPAQPPPPSAPQILQNMMMDPVLMRNAEDLRSVTKLAFWEAVGQGGVGKFLETETGKMLNFSLEQFGDALRTNAIKAGWMDPELEAAIKPSNMLLVQEFMTRDTQLANNTIDKGRYDQLTEEMAALESSMSPRQMQALWAQAVAAAPATANLMQGGNNAAQVREMAKSSEREALGRQSDLTFRKEAFAKTLDMSEREFNLKVKAFDAELEDKTRTYKLNLLTKQETIDAARAQVEIDRMKTLGYLAQNQTAALNTESESKQKLLDSFLVQLKGYVTQRDRLDTERVTGIPQGANHNPDPAWSGVDGKGKGQKQTQLDQLNAQIEKIQTNVQKLQYGEGSLSDPKFSAEQNPGYTYSSRAIKAMENAQKNGRLVPTTEDYQAAYGDSAGAMEAIDWPVTPPDMKLMADETLSVNAQRTLIEVFSKNLNNPKLAGTFASPEAFAQFAKAGGYGDPRKTYRHAKWLYEYAIRKAQTPPATPQPGNVKPGGGKVGYEGQGLSPGNLAYQTEEVTDAEPA